VRFAAALTLVAACGGGAAGPDGQTGPIDRHASIAAGAYLELNVDMPASSALTATFTGTAPVVWDVHIHPGGNVVILQQGEQATGTIDVAPSDRGGAYSLQWENKGAAAIELDLHVDLSGGASVISWLPR
jgi:hypothetical protein